MIPDATGRICEWACRVFAQQAILKL